MSRNAKFTSQKNDKRQGSIHASSTFFQGFLNVKEHVPRALLSNYLNNLTSPGTRRDCFLLEKLITCLKCFFFFNIA